MRYDRDNLPQRLADDYVLGGMQGQARRRFEALQREHQVFREARRAAERRWNPLAEAIAPVQPSPETWRSIEARINPARPEETASRGKMPWLWRGWALAATLLVAVLTVTIVSQPQPERDYVVVITSDVDATAGWLVSLQGGGERVKVASLTEHEIPNERVFELWVKPAGAPRVRSVGLISASGEIELQTQAELRAALSDAELFGVSVEPLGGSPTGQPTTTPLFHGKPRSI